MYEYKVPIWQMCYIVWRFLRFEWCWCEIKKNKFCLLVLTWIKYFRLPSSLKRRSICLTHSPVNDGAWWWRWWWWRWWWCRWSGDLLRRKSSLQMNLLSPSTYSCSPVLSCFRQMQHVKQFRWNTLSRGFRTRSEGAMPWPQPLHLVPYRLELETLLNWDYRLFYFQIYFDSYKKASYPQTFTYRKKSFRQYSLASRLKHLSVRGCRHSQHRTQCACQPRSRTLRRNLSSIGLLQPAQGSPTPTDGSARPAEEFTIFI